MTILYIGLYLFFCAAGLNWTTIPRADWNECQKILKIDWGAIYKECVRHGVLAIAWDGLLRLVEENVIPSSKLPERRLKIQWGINVKRIEQQYAEQWAIASDIALRYRGAGIMTLCLKGLRLVICTHSPITDLAVILIVF